MGGELRMAVIGLGIMGSAMAENLCKAGFPLAVWNRTRAKADALVAAGARAAATPAEAAAGADVVITMVTDAPDVEAVLLGEGGVVAGARRGAVVVDMSTIPPESARAIGQRLAAQGLDFLDAPVSGGDVGARNATLTIMVGGSEAGFARARPAFAAMGKTITHVGPSGSGQWVKACNQVLAAMNLMAVCEAMSLASAAGIPAATMLQVVTGGAAASWSLANLGPKIASGDMAPGFKVDHLQKDLRIVLEAAARAKLPLPGAALAAQLFGHAQAAGAGEQGTQSLIRAYEALSGRRIRGGA